MFQTITAKIQALFSRSQTASSTAPSLQWPQLIEAKVDIVVPCLNEEETLERNIRRLHRYTKAHLPWPTIITIADSGSTDTTLQIAERLSKILPDIRVHQEKVKGRGRVLKSAWQSSTADVLVYLDEDLSTDLTHLIPLIKPLVRGEAPVAIGSRRRSDSHVRRGLKREIISRAYIFLIHTLLHLKVSDAQCGFKAIRKDASERVLDTIVDTGWFFDTELLTRASRLGWKIHEVGVRWYEDTDSRVNIVQTAVTDIKGIFRLRQEVDEARLQDRLLFGGLLVLTAVFYLFNLSVNGYANSYYSAAVQAGSVSWHAFFYGALDSVGWVTVDKPPVAVWVSALLVRLFGFSSFSMLLPHALAGIATVALVYSMVRRYFGTKAALLGAAVMALTPAAALMFRFNNPDSILTLLLAASAYTFLRAVESGKTRWLLYTGLLVGTAFNTKMIQALIIMPVYLAVYLYAAKPKLLKRITGVIWLGISTAVASLWWPLVVSLVPSTERPYIGSTSDNNIWSLIFGYNGLNRFLGGSGQAGGGMGGGGGGMGGMSGLGGSTGLFRMFNSDFGPNIGWLLILGIGGAVATIWWLKREKRTNLQRALILTAVGWVVMFAGVFSLTGGTIHPYYVVVIAPALAMLVGAGVPYLWASYLSGRWTKWLLPITVFSSSVVASILFSYDTSWMNVFEWPVLIVGSLGAIGLTYNLLAPNLTLQRIVLASSIIAVAIGPTSYAFATVSVKHNGSIPTAGLEATAMATTNNEASSTDAALVRYLVSHQGDSTWIVAVRSANESAGIQISTGLPVMALGGFNGGDNTITLSEFQALVKAGKVKYYAVSNGMGGMGGGGFGGGMGSTNSISEISTWATTYGTEVDYGGSGNVTLYDLSTI